MKHPLAHIVFALLAATPLLPAQNIQLFKDLQTQGYADVPSNPQQFTLVGLDLFFTARAADTGTELYVARTGLVAPKLVTDLVPGVGGPGATALTAFRGKLLFGDTQARLFESDGTALGTKLVAQLDGKLTEAVVAGPRLFGRISTGIHGNRLMVSDGTSAGTRTLGPVKLQVQNLTAVGNRVFFSGQTSTTGAELWVSDGTPNGTHMVTDLHPGLSPLILIPNSANPASLHPLSQNVVLFEATSPPHMRALFRSDGTAQGTRFVKNIQGATPIPLPFNYKRVTIGGKQYFSSLEPGGFGLWVSDGTSAGTRHLAKIPGATSWIGTLNQDVYLLCLGLAPTRLELHRWTTSTGTHSRIKSLPLTTTNQKHGLWSDGKKIYFTGSDATTGIELWQSDGTSQGTVRVADINPGTANGLPRELTPTISGALLFSADDGKLGRELWMHQPGVGTRLFANIKANPVATQSAQVIDLSSHAGHLFFMASQRQPWVTDTFASDGTPAGTVLAATGQSTQRLRAELGADTYLYTSNNGVGALVRSDGSGKNNQTLYPGNPRQLGRVADAVVFVAPKASSSTGLELWRTRGGAGQRYFRFPGQHFGPSVSEFSEHGGRAWFVYTYSTISQRHSELWSTDGTAAGTRKLDGHKTNPTFDFPRPPISLGRKLVFTAHDANLTQRIYVSDGSTAGTIALSNPSAGPHPTLAAGHLVHQGKLYFGSKNSSNVVDLWVTDGTQAGTKPVKAIRTNARPAGPTHLLHFASAGSKFFFHADDGIHGTELWCSDGTSAGTQMVKDIYPGSSAALRFQSYPVGVGDKVYFIADDGQRGLELWQSDGTAQGTTIVQDLMPGPGSSSPRYPILHGGRLFLVASLPLYGSELHTVRIPSHSQSWGYGCADSGFPPQLSSTAPQIGAAFRLTVGDTGSQRNGALLLGAAPHRPFYLGAGCTLYVDLTQPHLVLPFVANQGSWTLNATLPNNPSLKSVDFAAQAGTGPSAQAPLGMNLSVGLWLAVR